MDASDGVGAGCERQDERVRACFMEHGGQIGEYVGAEDFDDDGSGNCGWKWHIL